MGARRGQAGPLRKRRGPGGKWRPARNRSGPGGKLGPAGGCSVGPGPRCRREHVVRQLDRVKDEEPYSELHPRVCEGLSYSFKVIVFGFKGASPVTATFPAPSAGCCFHTSCSSGLCAIAVHVTGSPGASWDPLTPSPWSPPGPHGPLIFPQDSLGPSGTPHIHPRDSLEHPETLPPSPWDASTLPQDNPEPPGTLVGPPHSPLGPLDSSMGTPAPAKCSGSAGAPQSIWAKERRASERRSEQGPPGCRKEDKGAVEQRPTGALMGRWGGKGR
ncbi:uncharacterized protein FN964_015812 [Alca torda]